MANVEHLEILNQGVQHWNKWRRKNQDVQADLSEADLTNRRLLDVNFRFVDLTRAHLDGALLSRADFSNAKLILASLRGSDISSAILYGSDASSANFEGAHATAARFDSAQLNSARFNGSDLIRASFVGSNLYHAKFKRARLFLANFEGADLEGVDVRSADLQGTSFTGAHIRSIRFNRWGKYKGIRLTESHGSQRFRRFARDQEYIEEFRSSRWRFPIYIVWLLAADCGRSLILWSLWCVSIVTGFAYKFFSLGERSFHLANLPWSFQSMLYYSVVTFTTLGFGDIAPTTTAAAWWVTAEVVVGYMMLGGLISIFATKLARRG